MTVENPKEAEGRKKLQLQLCPPAAKREMALALGHGAEKYGEWNWRDAGINLSTYIGALQRHLDAIQTGEDRDPSSDLSHWAHILAGAAIVVDAAECDMLNDDRPGHHHHTPAPSHLDAILEGGDVDSASGLSQWAHKTYEAAQARQDRAHRLTGEMSPREQARAARMFGDNKLRYGVNGGLDS